MIAIAALLPFFAVPSALADADSSTCTACFASTKAYEGLIDQWSEDTKIPKGFITNYLGEYDLWRPQDTRRFSAHNAVVDMFNTPEKVENVRSTIAGLLRKGQTKLLKVAKEMLKSTEPHLVPTLLVKVRAALNAYDQFWHQANTSISYGREHIESKNVPLYMEYGLETNYWVKFRPYLRCTSSQRIGPEIGGAKIWCNPVYFFQNRPRNFFSAGSGHDYGYEGTIFEIVPDAHVVTADCWQAEEEVYASISWSRDQFTFLQKCIHGKQEGDVDPRHDGQYVTFDRVLDAVKAKGIEHFDAIKCNIEAYEYTMFGYIFSEGREERILRGTSHIHLEHHRLGMQADGKNWNGLLLSELLWAYFMSGGFLPTSTEKWHDSTACQDVEFVNQTWFLESEVDMVRNVMDLKLPPMLNFPEDVGAFQCGEQCKAFRNDVTKSIKYAADSNGLIR